MHGKTWGGKNAGREEIQFVDRSEKRWRERCNPPN